MTHPPIGQPWPPAMKAHEHRRALTRQDVLRGLIENPTLTTGYGAGIYLDTTVGLAHEQGGPPAADAAADGFHDAVQSLPGRRS